MAIPAASGYPQYSGNLISPKVSMDLVELFYCSTIYPEISTTEYSGELMKCGDQITFFREPEVKVRDYVKNGVLEHDTIESEPVTMVIDKAKAFSLKLDWIDQKQICNWDKFREAAVRRASYNIAQSIDQDLLALMPLEVDPNNKGSSAGVISHGFDLGTVGSPITVDSANVGQYLFFLHAVLNEQCAPQEGRFVILPPIGEVVLLNSDLKAAYLTGLDTSTLISGKLPQKVAGFTVYISTNVPQMLDGGNDTYNIIAGYKGATGFAMQIERTKIAEDKDSFDTYWQGLAVYGFKVIQPKGLSNLYATFSI